jgi:hypothetical protein
MVVRPHCIIGHSYMSIKSQHEKNECLFYNKGRYSLANMVIMSDVVGKSKRKILHFVAKFWLLKQCCPLIDFDAMKMLFQFLKVKNAQKHIGMMILDGRLQKLKITLSSL